MNVLMNVLLLISYYDAGVDVVVYVGVVAAADVAVVCIYGDVVSSVVC